MTLLHTGKGMQEIGKITQLKKTECKLGHTSFKQKPVIMHLILIVQKK